MRLVSDGAVSWWKLYSVSDSTNILFFHVFFSILVHLFFQHIKSKAKNLFIYILKLIGLLIYKEIGKKNNCNFDAKQNYNWKNLKIQWNSYFHIGLEQILSVYKQTVLIKFEINCKATSAMLLLWKSSRLKL